MEKTALFLTFSLISSFGVLQGATSRISGNWSDPAAWSGGSPDASTPAVITTHTITVDGTGAVASSVTVQAGGTLFFARNTPARLDVTSGDVNVFGTLDMGTSADPVLSQAELVLAKSSIGGARGLILQTGAVFTAQGQVKTPFALASTPQTISGNTIKVALADSQGWVAGDTVVIGRTRWSSSNEDETFTIQSRDFADPVTLTLSGSTVYPHVATAPAVVANLTRNVVIKSLGTAAIEKSYLRVYSDGAGFTARHAEFSGLGYAAGGDMEYFGLALGSGVSSVEISSCSIHHGYRGIVTYDYHAPTQPPYLFSDNVIFGHASSGMVLSDPGYDSQHSETVRHSAIFGNADGITIDRLLGIFIEDNLVFGNTFSAINTAASRGLYRLTGNKLFSNGQFGIESGTPGCTIYDNDIYDNQSSDNGVRFTSDGTIFVGNRIFGNRGAGVGGSGDGTVLIDNFIYGNQGGGFTANSRMGFVRGGALGYMPDRITLRPNLFGVNAGQYGGRVVLSDVQIQPGQEVRTDMMNQPDVYVLSVNHNRVAGEVRFWGDYTISGSTLALDQASPVFAPRATPPMLLRGISSTATVTGVTDNAVSQLVTIRCLDGINWRVEGSSQGVMHAFSGSLSSQPISYSGGPAQFSLTFIPGPSAAAGDLIDIAVLGPSGDAGVSKQFLAGPSAGTSGSRLVVAPGAGLTLRGSVGNPARIDRISGSTSYLTLISSGAFTAEYASLNNIEAGGLRLTGSGPVQIASTAFDNAGFVTGTNAYITIQSLSSSATFYNLAFGNSRVPAANQTFYNINAAGAGAGLSWALAGWSGAYGGPSFESDPNHGVRWLDVVPPNPVTALSAVPAGFGGLLLSWSSPADPPSSGYLDGRWRIFYSTNAVDLLSATTAQAQVTVSTALPAGTPVSYLLSSLPLYATYYVQLWVEDETPNVSSVSGTGSGLPDQRGPEGSFSAMAMAGGFAARTTGFSLSFDKPVQPASVTSSFRLRRIRDNRGNAVDEAMTVTPGGSGSAYTFIPQFSLAGNSVYEVLLSSGVLDLNGAPSTGTLTQQFTTFMDRSEENLWAKGDARVVFSPLALASDGYVQEGAAPAASVATATRKLQTNLGGDPFASPVGTVASLTAYDQAGVTQAGTFGAPVEVSLSYPDADDDGVVNGTNPPVRAKTLAVHWLDEERNVWFRLPSSRVDTSSHRVSARAPHFTAFALIGQAETDLSGAHAFPNPFRAGSGADKITFTRLGSITTVRIYTMWGQLVREITASDGLGAIDWDVKNQSGEAAASGLYLYKITSGGETKTGHVAVLR
jgi:hypothetical protein